MTEHSHEYLAPEGTSLGMTGLADLMHKDDKKAAAKSHGHGGGHHKGHSSEHSHSHNQKTHH